MDPDPGFFFYGGSDPFVEKVDSLISVMKSLYSRISNEGKKSYLFLLIKTKSDIPQWSLFFFYKYETYHTFPIISMANCVFFQITAFFPSFLTFVDWRKRSKA